MAKLSPRMEEIISMIPRTEAIADVGCDHGFVSIELVERGIANRVIAMDLRPGPLSRAQEHIEEENLKDRIETRLSDGLTALREGEVRGAVIAGMGGPLMIDILRARPELVKGFDFLLLQPQSEIHLVRAYLRRIGFSSMTNRIVWEGDKVYFPILARPAQVDTSEADLEDYYGADLLRNEAVLRPYLEYEQAGLLQLIDQLEGLQNPPELRLEEIRTKLNRNRKALLF